MALSGVTHNPNAQIELGRVLKHLFHLNPLRQRAAEDHIQNIALRMKDEQFSDIKKHLVPAKKFNRFHKRLLASLINLPHGCGLVGRDKLWIYSHNFGVAVGIHESVLVDLLEQS